jgi:sarcosine oxidase gamma subunit
MHGTALNDLLRQTCSVDFLPLLSHAAGNCGPLVLASMIGVGVVAIPRASSGRRELTLWVEPSFAHYFWTTLLTLVADLGGGVQLDQPNGV